MLSCRKLNLFVKGVTKGQTNNTHIRRKTQKTVEFCSGPFVAFSLALAFPPELLLGMPTRVGTVLVV